MSTPQNTIAIVYDYDQTLSPSYMQDEVVFPTFGIDGKSFWRRCSEFVREKGYASELAYMKVLLDTLGMDRPTNDELRQLGAQLNFYQRLPEMFDDFRDHLLTDSSALTASRSSTTSSPRACRSPFAGRMVDEVATRMVEQRHTEIETGTVRAPRH